MPGDQRSVVVPAITMVRGTIVPGVAVTPGSAEAVVRSGAFAGSGAVVRGGRSGLLILLTLVFIGRWVGGRTGDVIIARFVLW